MVLQRQQKTTETRNVKKNRFLITVNVVGSAGPIRFVVSEEDCVSTVIDTALKLYAREGRLPVLGNDISNFLLYPVNAGSDDLVPSEKIGSCKGRIFVLCKKRRQSQNSDGRSDAIAQKRSCSWTAWLNSLFIKLLHH